MSDTMCRRSCAGAEPGQRSLALISDGHLLWRRPPAHPCTGGQRWETCINTQCVSVAKAGARNGMVRAPARLCRAGVMVWPAGSPRCEWGSFRIVGQSGGSVRRAAEETVARVRSGGGLHGSITASQPTFGWRCRAGVLLTRAPPASRQLPG
jgi:hypothetical protein